MVTRDGYYWGLSDFSLGHEGLVTPGMGTAET